MGSREEHVPADVRLAGQERWEATGLEPATDERLLFAPPVGGLFQERFERKFFILPKNTAFAYALLRHACRPDHEYPREQINSLYFDAPDLDQHERSAEGEFDKDKVRLRWYGENGTLPRMVPVFLELKSRRGFASSKRRERLLVPAENLGLDGLRAGIVNRTTLLDTVARFGHFPGKPLRPIVLVSYWRYRFTEILTGFPVCLDGTIRSTLVARELGYGERDLQLRGGVIEVKGPGMDLPRTLRRLELLDADWSRFSKYGQCIDAHLEGLGTVGRLWPSGRMAEP
jgi:hypothetical protein